MQRFRLLRVMILQISKNGEKYGFLPITPCRIKIFANLGDFWNQRKILHRIGMFLVKFKRKNFFRKIS